MSKDAALQEYLSAPIIEAPKEIPPIFIYSCQTDDELTNLSVTLSLLRKGISPEQYSKVQVLEVPFIKDDCQQYINRGYYNTHNDEICCNNWNPEGYIKLDNIDITARKGWEKVFVWGSSLINGRSSLINARHYANMWGDGTIISKFGDTGEGATAVYRTTTADHPIYQVYGNIGAVYVRKHKNEKGEFADVPCAYSRFPSKTYIYGKIPESDQSVSIKIIKDSGNSGWFQYFCKARDDRDLLIKNSLSQKANQEAEQKIIAARKIQACFRRHVSRSKQLDARVRAGI